MSEKWETVGSGKPKSGKTTQKTNGQVKKAAKQVIEKGPRMEDVLPTAQVEALNQFTAAFDQPPSPKKESKSPKAKPAAKKVSKKDEKPKLPATIEEAVKKNLRVEDIKNLIDSTQQRFPDSPLLWLRDIAAYLNLKLVTDPPLKETVLTGGPMTALTANMRKVINVMINNVEQSMKETFFETCVANTAHDSVKGHCVTGWKILTQLLSEQQTCLGTAHLPRYVELRNSYQNRPITGIDILWSVGQAGKKDLNAGLKIWMELMLPVLNLRHYTKFVVEYLEALISVHNITPATCPNRPSMDISSFLVLQDSVFVGSGTVNKELGKQLRGLYPCVRAMALAGCKDPDLFPALLDRLSLVNMPDLVLDTLAGLAECLAASPAATVQWHRAYTSHLPASGQLLNYLDTHWNKYKACLDVPAFHETIEAFQDYNSSVINDGRKEGLSQCLMACESLEGKMSVPGGAWFPWKTLSFLLLIATAAIINIDVNKHGNFKRSNTGQFMKDIGQYDRTMAAYQLASTSAISATIMAKEYGNQGYSMARKHAGPTMDVMAAKANEASGLAIKYGQAGLENAREMVKAGVDKVGVMLPGLEDQAKVYWAATKDLAIKGANAASQGWKEVTSGNVEIDWDGLKSGAIEKAVYLQKQLEQVLQWSKDQINTLVK